MNNNSPDDVFRFVQLRPPSAIDPEDRVELSAGTEFAKSLVAAPHGQRGPLAETYVARALPQVAAEISAAPSRRLLQACHEVLGEEGTLRDLHSAAAEIGDWKKRAHVELLSDYLLAIRVAATGGIRNALALFRAVSALHHTEPSWLDRKLSTVLRQPIVLPDALTSSGREAPTKKRAGADESPSAEDDERGRPDWAVRSHKAQRELLELHRSQVARKLASGQRPTEASGESFVLDDESAQRLSADSRHVLRTLAIDPTRLPIIASTMALESEIAAAANIKAAQPLALAPMAAGPTSAAASLAEPRVRASGVADLLVVKQHLKGYQRTDIAHVENVLTGERKLRVHRSLERSEQTFITERETTKEKETELQSAERFELNQETQKTIQHDQQIGFGLTISGKYGPTVEFSSSFEADFSSSTEESTRNAVTYAKDVMQRSLERVTDRVREEQIRKLIREVEETNTHELNNETGAHVIGVYQFLEKEYESQIFNYGIRQMFDFMLPEPASYLWHLETSPGAEMALPPQPPKLETFVTSAAGVNAGNYLAIAAAVGAKGLEPPPPLVKTASASVKHGETGDEGGHPQSIVDKEIGIPDGYSPWSALARVMALTDDDLTIAVTIGTDTQTYLPRGGAVTQLGGVDLGATELFFALSGATLYDPQSKLAFHVVAYESNSYSVVVTVQFLRTVEALTAWQIKTYDNLYNASREQQLRYDQLVADLRARAETAAARQPITFGSPPSQNLLTIKGELKKHCLSIVTKQWYDTSNGMGNTDPPTFDLAVAAERGEFTRFFEQAFEWDQLQYVCYPYFWARKSMWADRFRREEVDPVLQEFLKAGAARVVVPVRPGFDAAVLYFLETLETTGTGVIWNGSGSPVDINSPLYVSIVTEIQERTGAPQGEIPVGEPWTTVVPTPLVILRRETDLPEWQRQSPQGWDWDEKLST